MDEKDKDFSAWKAAGNLPTSWPKNEDGKETDEALAEVLAGYGLRMFPQTLDETKEALKARVDVAAEKERLKYITNGVGQSMTYTEKFNQAVDYSKKYAAHIADPKNVTTPDENEYPLLRASIGIDGSSMIEVAETVTYAFAIWEKIGAAIEGIRLKAKAAIADAKTEEAAQAVFASIKWPNALSA
ncbi:hypothetical protein H3S89_03115 [Bartonella sp. B10834G6]|uniref:hypothetical protein n=1 Tax=Bartonella TaxID=773 RepID=UPI0018DE41F3|nr:MULTISPECIES: hypothetical protein [Bartonella]MBH9981785.1 hypothetical protein [Bartonella apis]MBI0169882.1 hypothetical protein [Bartonella sp. W8167]MBI0176140.1 hypothetical protein [Bartonella apis]